MPNKKTDFSINSITTNWCFPSLNKDFTGPLSSRAFEQCIYNRNYMILTLFSAFLNLREWISWRTDTYAQKWFILSFWLIIMLILIFLNVIVLVLLVSFCVMIQSRLCKFEAVGWEFVTFSRHYSCLRELGKKVTNTWKKLWAWYKSRQL